jgi:hypothetical protein
MYTRRNVTKTCTTGRRVAPAVRRRASTASQARSTNRRMGRIRYRTQARARAARATDMQAAASSSA